MSRRLTSEELEVYRRYAGLHLPRHTSYPASPFWRDDYGPDRAEAALDRCRTREGRLSLYFHILYCEQLCYFCACNKVIQPKRDPAVAEALARRNTDLLLAELELKARHLGSGRPVAQVHLGGGSPTYLPPEQLRRLFQGVRERFRLEPDAELAVEVDPRVTSDEHLAAMREEGVNRLSLGVQDFDETVQRAVNRLQPLELVQGFMSRCRAMGYDAINFDLIYGLPFQTPESMAETLQRTVELGPDRIAFYRLAVIPEIFKWQKTFKPADLPRSEATVAMFQDARAALDGAGYEFIGLDHFARREEGLAAALRAGTLRRTFQGMTTGGGLDVVGMGPSGISILEDAYFQNAKTAEEWTSAVEAGRQPAERGMDLSDEDRLRRDLLQDLYCYTEVRWDRLRATHGVDGARHFASELERLKALQADGLVHLDEGGFRLSPLLGRLLMRVPASVFDAYLPPDAWQSGLEPAESSLVG